ncbi:HIRAN domain-containing protein [Aeromicrobium sp. 50.2.37]|uniref:HIRAN domain-containing protein n=1 Tax=Aeromicrobium sp. 50.2.37 TaxID=2969305 RepID=UPI00215019C1|nr:HIRAN domain-containing protein [Aeromicrobium sp. 50.2.37]MCR4512949.1 HIRAN domain-containing protein [Aeromicrobium sp. 50.2.37]
MGFFGGLFKQAPPKEASFAPVHGEQMFVGESHYQSELVELLKSRGHVSKSMAECRVPINEPFTARLVPEPRNPHDANAVAVVVENHTVAYLSRANAKEYRKSFGTREGQVAVSLWVKPRGKGIVSVWPQE